MCVRVRADTDMHSSHTNLVDLLPSEPAQNSGYRSIHGRFPSYKLALRALFALAHNESRTKYVLAQGGNPLVGPVEFHIGLGFSHA